MSTNTALHDLPRKWVLDLYYHPKHIAFRLRNLRNDQHTAANEIYPLLRADLRSTYFPPWVPTTIRDAAIAKLTTAQEGFEPR